MKKFICIAFLIYIQVAKADIGKDLNNYFDSLGFSTNVSKPTAYHGQSAGYYSGGSLVARNALRNVHIMQIDLPQIRSGCGGIDLYMGGFSFINSQTMIETLKNLLNSSKAVAFTLALETVTPEIANVLKKWQDELNKINQANINSCEMTTALVGSVMSKNSAAQRQVCESMGTYKTDNNIFSDWAQARVQCGHGGKLTDTINRARNDENYKDSVFITGNIVWKAMQKMPLLQSDYKLAELFMSLSGTVVLYKEGKIDDDNAKLKHKEYPAIVQNNDIITALLIGGTANIYHCDSTEPYGCLKPKEISFTLKPEDSFHFRVKNILSRIVNKIYADEPLVADEIGLLQSTSLPVYKMLNVSAAFQKDKSIIDVTGYADVIATDILFQYMHESLKIVRNSVRALDLPEEILEKITKNIEFEMTDLRKKQGSAYKQLAEYTQIIEQTQVLERMLAGDLSSQLASNLSWAKGLK